MKILKTYEMYIDEYNKDLYEDKLKNYKFKVGDYVKWNNFKNPYYNNTNYYRVIKINTLDEERPYLISNVKNGAEYWTLGHNFKFVPDEEFAAIKYNL